MADEIKRVGLAGNETGEKPRKAEKYKADEVVSFPLGSEEDKAWIERQRQLDNEDDDISDLDELEDLFPVEDMSEDEDYLANLSRNLEDARRYKHRPGADASETRRLVLIRHGKTGMNDPDPKKDRIRGWEDVPLDDEGRDEARALGEKLAEEMDGDLPDFLVSSDLSRALETAETISAITDVPLVWVSRAFRPWNVGGFVGMVSIEAVPVLTDHYVRQNPDDPIPGGESFSEFRDRFFAGLATAFARLPGTVGVVSHHRNERVLDGWREAGFPLDRHVDIATFAAKGEPTGKCMVVEVPLDRLMGERE